jgi:threonine/homoserine/homoserine lactone efflux protein
LLPVWGFIAVALPLVATPGASTAVVLRNSIAGGVRGGVLTAIGCNSGNAGYGVLTAFGFAVALQRWPSVWLVLRVAGVLYLGWLGLVSLRRAVHPGSRPAVAGRPAPADAWRSVSSGFLTNVLNPSLAAFYLIVVPQFIPREAPFARSALTLTAIHVGMAFSWHCAWAVAGSTLARALSSGPGRRVLDTLAGVALLWLAVKVAI